MYVLFFGVVQSVGYRTERQRCNLTYERDLLIYFCVPVEWTVLIENKRQKYIVQQVKLKQQKW